MYKTQTKFTGKQSTKFSLPLTQNVNLFLTESYSLQDGTHLSKNTLTSNRRSHKFLDTNIIAKSTAQSILNSTHATMFRPPQYPLDSLETYEERMLRATNYDERFKATVDAAENMTDNKNQQKVCLVWPYLT
jgi:hypothetical protein